MLRPPPLKDLPRYPITALAGIGAIIATFALFKDPKLVEPFLMSEAAFHSEPWRLVTSALPHATPTHILFNLYWLWAFGTILETAFGHFRFLLFALLFAAASAAGEYALFQGGIGLSGVVYGLFGMLWALRRRPGFVGTIDKITIKMFIAWFFICIVTTWIGVMNVANAAHGAGAIMGFLVGRCYGTKDTKRAAYITGAVAFVAVVGVGSTLARPYINLHRPSAYDIAFQGQQAIDAGNIPKAVELFAKAVHKDPSDTRYWQVYAAALELDGRKAEAMNAWQEALRLNPKDAKLAQYIQAVRTAPDPSSAPSDAADREASPESSPTQPDPK